MRSSKTLRTVFRKLTFLQIVLLGCIAAGALCAIYQYFYNRSLWLDEAALALNIIDRSFGQLIRPLTYNQVAPIGFLMVEKAMVCALAKSELALRLFPLLCFLASIPMFYRSVKTLTKDVLFALLSTAIFSTTLALISYASEVKQYIVDVMATTFFLVLATYQSRNIAARVIILSLAGIIIIWFSNISVILLFVLGIYLLWKEAYQNRRYALLLPLFLWALSFLLYYMFFVHNHPSTNSMQEYWEKFFMPLSPFSREFYTFFVQTGQDMYGYLFGFREFWSMPLLVSVAGIVMLFKKKGQAFVYLCTAPVIVHLILSGLKMYPFTGRLILYLLPLIILLYSAGIFYVFELLRDRVHKFPRLLLIIPVLFMFYPLLLKFPVEKEEVKKSLQIIEQQIGPNEQVYIYNSTIMAVRYYQKTGFTDLDAQMVYGSQHRDQNLLYHPELLSLSGKCWLLFSHVYTSPSEGNEEKYMVEYLLKNGARIIDKWEFKGSSCYYIDTLNTMQN
jgi:hypothetical protein